MESEECAVDTMENRRLPLFPIEPEPSVTATQRLTLLATRYSNHLSHP